MPSVPPHVDRPARAGRDPSEWISYRQRAIAFHRRSLERFGRLLRREVAGDREFAVCIASDKVLRAANLRFRGIDRVTDVLAFPHRRPARLGRHGRQLGDILISAGRAQAQAQRLGHSTGKELRVLLLHGLLHLLGYDHEVDSGSMKLVERRWRRRLGIPPGLLER